MQCVTLTKGSERQCAWERSEPNPFVYFMYAVVLPMLTIFGFVANFLNALVFMRPKMTHSVFTYLAALSWVDCLSCFTILLTSLSRGIFFNSIGWIRYDFQWQTPLFGILTGGANWILAATTLDRIIYLRHGLPKRPPNFCTRRQAQINIFGIMVMSAIINIPYFFIFVVQEDGTFYTTNFYYSKFYKVQNWFSFTMLCILPGLFLLIGNTVVIIIFNQWVKKFKSISAQEYGGCLELQKRHQHQNKLTITVITVVFLYLIGELPAHITSKKSAINLLFGGDATKIRFQTVEEFELIFLTLNALQLSFNIIVYAIVNPLFMSEFFIFLQETSKICFLLLGITALHKASKTIRIRLKNRQTHVIQDPENTSYAKEIYPALNKPREYYIKNNCNNKYAMSDEIAYRKWKSCLDLRLIIVNNDSDLTANIIIKKRLASI